jgi:hypothetical protein
LSSILPHDRRRRFQPNADCSALVDKGALGSNSLDDIFASQYRRHSAILRCSIALFARAGLNVDGLRRDNFRNVIPEIDIWRAANLMLKRYGDNAHMESAARVDELAADGDHNGVLVWRRIMDAVVQT